MLKRTNELKPEDLSSLKELISTEKARLRWRLGVTANDDTWRTNPEDGAPTSKLYRVFSSCLGD